LPLFCDNFLRCVESVLGVDVDWEQRAVTREDHTCYVRSFPISIDIEQYREHARNVSGIRWERMKRRYVPDGGMRSEERRVGKERGARWLPGNDKKIEVEEQCGT